MSRNDFLELVFEYAEANSIPYPFKGGKAGEDCFARFRRRHPELLLRTPEPTSIARARGFNRPQVERFYRNLWEQIQKYNCDANSIYNMDVTWIHTTTNRPPK